MAEEELSIPKDVQRRVGLVYGTGGGRELECDVYEPAERTGTLRPAVVYVHGGGWQTGSRQHFARQAREMARRGFIGLCMEYRLSDEATWPAQIQDVKCALRFLRALSEEMAVDADRIGIAGGSAGGQLALMAAVTCGTERLEGTGGHGDFSSDVQAAVGFNPAVDLRERGHVEGVQKLLGGEPREVGRNAYEDASPICHADEGVPPVLLLHGTDDETVAYQQSVQFCETVREAGGEAELFTAEGAGHGFFNDAPWYQPTLERMIEFFESALTCPG